jgi:group II intron reverse transcriptase/maturase
VASLLTRIADGSTLRIAFARVRANHGCAGADDVGIDAFERDLDRHLTELSTALARRTYRPFPLLRILVEKADGSSRQLCIPAVRDRVAQAAALEILGSRLDAELEACSFGYRHGRSVRDAVHQIKTYYDAGYRWVVEADVDAYFDSIDHARLLKRVADLFDDLQVQHLLRLWVEATVWDGSQLYRLKRGIPQGSVISPALANLFLDAFDETLLAAGHKLVRYADDFVILCRDRPTAERAVALTEQTLASLALVADELAITSFDAGFRFLGVTFIRSMVLLPFDHARPAKHVLFMPPPLPPGLWREIVA